MKKQMMLGVVASALLATTACSGIGGAGAGSTAADGEYPSRNLSVIVPVPAGSSTDLSTRVVMPCLEKELGTSIIVENRDGGSGAVGNATFARADADGYTLVSTTAANAVLPPIQQGNVGFSADDFVPVGMIGEAPIAVVVPKDSPYQTVQDLLAAAQKGTVSVGSPGATSVPGISLAAINKKYPDYGLKAVAFDGNSNTMAAVVSGEVEAGYMSADGGVVLPRVKTGEVRILAVATPEPVPSMPDVPTLDSVGLTDLPYGNSFWFLATQKGTPQEVVDTLEGAMQNCMTDDDVTDAVGEGVAPEEFIDGATVKAMLDEADQSYAEDAD